ncbi:hypothetical protein LINGRAHAP2_LOCUS23266 [Linum grandiflorum]
MSQPNSLVARLFRAKYYPSGNMPSAPLGPRPSFVRRSLWLSLELFNKGY